MLYFAVIVLEEIMRLIDGDHIIRCAYGVRYTAASHYATIKNAMLYTRYVRINFT